MEKQGDKKGELTQKGQTPMGQFNPLGSVPFGLKELEMRKVAFCTLGCKVNQYETNAMEQQFIEKGYKVVSFNDIADIYVINTCTVTNMSDKKSRQMIRRAKQLNPKAIVIAVGCYVQVAKNKLEEIKQLDLILGNNEKKEIVKYIEEYKAKSHFDDVMHQKEFVDFGTTVHMEKTRAIIKVQDGCDRFCSYCIIPYARGRVRSRSLESVITEVEKLAQNGVKEIIVTGIHVASYGKDFNKNIGLIELLEELNKIDGIERIRLGSLEPMIITEAFLKRLIKLKKICHHFHLSLQSACNETLKRMNRKYTIEDFKNIVNLLRNNYNDVILTTDIIVGFPGETDEEFNITYENLKQIAFYKMHVFKYSRRDGTKAALMPKQVFPQIQEKRSKILIELSNKNEKKYNKELIGCEVKVLFEEQDGNFIKGHTDNYIVIKVEKEDITKHHNEIRKVKVERIENNELIGKIV